MGCMLSYWSSSFLFWYSAPLNPLHLFWSFASLSILHRCMEKFPGKSRLTTGLNAGSVFTLAHNMLELFNKFVHEAVINFKSQKSCFVNALCPSPSFREDLFKVRCHVQQEPILSSHFSCTRSRSILNNQFVRQPPRYSEGSCVTQLVDGFPCIFPFLGHSHVVQQGLRTLQLSNCP